MVNRPLLRKIRRDLWARKLALLSLVLIAAIGVASFTSMACVYRDMDGSRERYYNNQRLADFTVDLKRAPEWTVKDLEFIPNVRQAQGRVSMSVLVDLPANDAPISGIALSLPAERRPVINDVVLRSGAWFSSDKQVLVDESFANANDLRPGSRLKVMLLDCQHDLLIVGTVMSPEFVFMIPPSGGLAPDPERFGVLYMRHDFLRKACDLEGAFNQIVGLAHDNSPPALERVLDRIERRLEPYGVTNKIPVQDQPSVRFLHDELYGLKISVTIMPSLFLGVAALVLNIMLSRLVAQQRSVIGTLKALGYSSAAITRHYLTYGVLIGIVGGAAGLALGWPMQKGLVSLYQQFYHMPDITAHVYPGLLSIGMAISVTFAVLGTIKGVRYAIRLSPAEAMSPPPPEKGGRVLPERFPFFWKRLSFRGKMIQRSIFRNPFRSNVSMFSAAIATALIFTTLSMVSAVDYLMLYEFDKVAHQDLRVSLRDAEDIRAISEVRGMDFISDVEPQLCVACDLTNGAREKRIAVTGMLPDNYLYTPLDGAGRPIVLPEKGLVLSKKLAEILGVGPGDSVRFRPLIGRRREVRAFIAGTVDTFLGLSAYADIGYLSELLGEAPSANTILARTYTQNSPPVTISDLKKRPSVIGIDERIRSLSQMDKIFGDNMKRMLGVSILFAGLIAFGSVLNTALVSVGERQREIGSLRVLGYSPRQIGAIFCGESILVNLVGVGLGIFLGIGLGHLLSKAYDTEFYRFPVVITPADLVICVSLMLLFIGAAQGIVLVIVGKVRWLEVLSIKE